MDARRLPPLDGLRGLSIIAVLLAHLTGTDGFPIKSAWVAELGVVGVELFFVLSGFLITALLVREHAVTGGFPLGTFYARRSFRIFPAAYVYFGTVLVLRACHLAVLQPGDASAALTYTMNFQSHPAWWLGHTWTLSIEEQFYLLWPAVIWLSPARYRAASAATVFAGTALARAALIAIHPSWADIIERSLLGASDGFAAGALLAVARPALERHPLYRRAIRSALIPWGLALVWLLEPLGRHPLVFFAVALPFSYAALALVIHHALVTTGGFYSRLLRWRPLVWLGVMSYSLYLWQQPFLYPHGGHLLQRFPLNLVLALGCARLSYLFIERPALRLREALAPAPASVRPAPAVLPPDPVSVAGS